MDINGVSETGASAGYDVHPQPVATRAPQPMAAPSAAEGQPAQSNERTKQMVEDIQKNMSNMDVSLCFDTYGANDDQVCIVLKEKETGKVIREIPSKELQSLYMKMQEWVGMVLNKQA